VLPPSVEADYINFVT